LGGSVLRFSVLRFSVLRFSVLRFAIGDERVFLWLYVVYVVYVHSISTNACSNAMHAAMLSVAMHAAMHAAMPMCAAMQCMPRTLCHG
jgi:hypothetical protein